MQQNGGRGITYKLAQWAALIAGGSLLYKEGVETRDLYRVENDAVIGTDIITTTSLIHCN